MKRIAHRVIAELMVACLAAGPMEAARGHRREGALFSDQALAPISSVFQNTLLGVDSVHWAQKTAANIGQRFSPATPSGRMAHSQLLLEPLYHLVRERWGRWVSRLFVVFNILAEEAFFRRYILGHLGHITTSADIGPHKIVFGFLGVGVGVVLFSRLHGLIRYHLFRQSARPGIRGNPSREGSLVVFRRIVSAILFTMAFLYGGLPAAFLTHLAWDSLGFVSTRPDTTPFEWDVPPAGVDVNKPFPNPVRHPDHAGSLIHTSFLGRHEAQWTWLRQHVLPVMIQKKAIQPEGLKLEILVLGASTGEELARGFHEAIAALKKEGQAVEDWTIVINGIELSQSAVKEGRDRLRGDAPFDVAPGTSDDYAKSIHNTLNSHRVLARHALRLHRGDLRRPEDLGPFSSADIVIQNVTWSYGRDISIWESIRRLDLLMPNAVLAYTYSAEDALLSLVNHRVETPSIPCNIGSLFYQFALPHFIASSETAVPPRSPLPSAS